MALPAPPRWLPRILTQPPPALPPPTKEPEHCPLQGHEATAGAEDVW